MLVGWSAETNPNRALGPGTGLGWQQVLDAVLPEDPCVHALWDGRGAHGQLPQLFRLKAPRLTQGEAGTFGHFFRLSNKCPTT